MLAQVEVSRSVKHISNLLILVHMPTGKGQPKKHDRGKEDTHSLKKIFDIPSYASPSPSLLTLIMSRFLYPLSRDLVDLVLPSIVVNGHAPVRRADGSESREGDGAAGVV